jgi:hypothetical protein
MRKRTVTIGWGPREDCPQYVDLAFRVYGKDGQDATLIITMHAAETVSNAGFQSALFVQPDPKLSFSYQVGEMYGFLSSFLATARTADHEFVGIILVNHLPRPGSGKQPVRQRETLDTLSDGAERFCELISKSLTTGIHEWESRECDWVYLDCEAVID